MMKITNGVIIVFIILLYGCASQDLDLRIANLERRITVLEQGLGALENSADQLSSRFVNYETTREDNEQKIRNQTAGLYADAEKLRERILILKGQLEETDHLLRQKVSLIEDIDRKSEEDFKSIETVVNLNKDRIVRLEQYMDFEIIDKLEPKVDSESQENVLLSENEQYASAKGAFDQGEFETAREGFQKLLKGFPSSKHADNAQFWIGEIYYREKWYEKAILEYQKVIEKYPKGNKVPASLLKQGFAFLNLRDKANARLILQELIKKYPQSNEADLARKKIKELK